eukprot:TRINITY_DN11764_c0_g1::TRINITY_DN11764_c0_g1_i1::g.11575::m.11575 TRINITY_DN11764_c0_g1::TRINITY_DN11764_c0_g1_i1::g.11575  ORF type:complete len:608 (+),score=118.63,sp/Q338B9/GCN5_ORYSJ/48.75/4e-115,Bromodomain/PF00439.20/3.4e-21,Acetyltransf_7/PF13508.1/3.4e-08,Acetyltransf_1/PF00583.19/8.1e-08,Acetyltransf_10/PF13673.1/0.016,PCAF_N/PF06466.6/0.047,FR47/PF08445.5/0.38 TRINITY_DN11764_c0_g1_i1:135-1958(+)
MEDGDDNEIRTKPPFETPVIADFISAFIQIKYGEARDDDYIQAARLLLQVLDSMQIPPPTGGSATLPHQYAMYYQAWRRVCCGGANQPKEGCRTFTECFGKTMLLPVLKPAEKITNMTRKDEASPLFTELVRDLQQELSKTESDIVGATVQQAISLGPRNRFIDGSTHVGSKRANPGSEDGPMAKRIKLDGEGGGMGSTGSGGGQPFPVLNFNGPEPPLPGLEGLWLQPVPCRGPRCVDYAPSDEERELLECEGLYGYTARWAVVRREEIDATIKFYHVNNDSHRESLKYLVGLKNLFAKQLPKMPKEYITRLVFDRRHHSIALVKNGKVGGGICFRPFVEQNFAEIAFCAIHNNEQVKGYGTRLMNQVKEFVKTEFAIHHFLTYADNFAVGYFKKQGFTKQITQDRENWVGYIKDYDGGTLMECVLQKTINYLLIPVAVRIQRKCLNEKLKEVSNSHLVFPGLECFKDGASGVCDIKSISGLLEAGYKEPLNGPARAPALDEQLQLRAQLKGILKLIKHHPAAWPFSEPVKVEEVPDYLDIIKDPIDLKTIEERLDRGPPFYYKTKDIFVADLVRMCENCRTYNSPDTVYYQCADQLQAFFMDKIS